jgi:hypothetical protein
MKKLALVLAAAAAIVGCEQKPKEGPKPAAAAPEAKKTDEGSGSPQAANPDKPKIVRRVVDPSKKGQIAVYVCGCTGKEWKQPAEEEKLCIDECKGEMPDCGELVRTEPEGK